jgi:hypothetical protein
VNGWVNGWMGRGMEVQRTAASTWKDTWRGMRDNVRYVEKKDGQRDESATHCREHMEG